MSNFEYPSLIFLLSSLGLLFLFAFIKFMYGSWWIPIYIQKKMRQQGINVISYSFPYGNSKEINKMRMEAISRPMDLSSHNILPRLQPHIYLWLNIYGNCIYFSFYSSARTCVCVNIYNLFVYHYNYCIMMI